MKMKFSIGLFTALLLTTLFFGCNHSLSFPTGVHGVAILQSSGNVFPPPPVTHQPLAGAIIVIQNPNNGQEVARQTADASGGFQIDVTPGTYVLTAQAPQDQGPMLAPAPQNIVVTSDRLTQVVVTFSAISHF